MVLSDNTHVHLVKGSDSASSVRNSWSRPAIVGDLGFFQAVVLYITRRERAKGRIELIVRLAERARVRR